MPAQVDFTNDGKIAILTYTGTFILDDIRHTDALVAPHLDQTAAPMTIIVDLSGLRSLAPGALSTRNSLLFNHKNIGAIIFVGGNGGLRAVADMVVRLSGCKNACFVNTLDAALDRAIQQPT